MNPNIFRFNKTGHYIALREVFSNKNLYNIGYSQFWETFKGKPRDKSELLEVYHFIDSQDLPNGYAWRSKNRLIEENPEEILKRGEELISTRKVGEK